jgi:oxygen-dependent protoporphyrinogen oxidase
VVFEHNKGPGRAPPGKGALSLFWRDSWSRARMNLDEATIIRNTIPQARSVIPDFDESLIEAAHVERWAGAGVARQVGGTQAVVAVEAAGAKMHNLALAGDYSALSGVNAAVISGQIAAQKIIASKKINKNTVVRA